MNVCYMIYVTCYMIYVTCYICIYFLFFLKYHKIKIDNV
jgi:hypothetical protein